MTRRRRTPGRDSRGRFTKGHGLASKVRHLVKPPQFKRFTHRNPVATAEERRKLAEIMAKYKKEAQEMAEVNKRAAESFEGGHGLRKQFIQRPVVRHGASPKAFWAQYLERHPNWRPSHRVMN